MPAAPSTPPISPASECIPVRGAGAGNRFAMAFLWLAATLLIVQLPACSSGGSGGAPPASGLVYTDPVTDDYRFVRDAGLSTPTHLVLDLVGPATATGRGVGFTFQADPGPVAWAMVSPGDTQYLQNAGFDLGPGIPLLKTAVQGGTLQAGVFQKGPGHALPLSMPLCRVALDALPPSAARAIALQVVQLQVLPATGSALADVTASCAVGTLAFQ